MVRSGIVPKYPILRPLEGIQVEPEMARLFASQVVSIESIRTRYAMNEKGRPEDVFTTGLFQN